MNMLKDPSPLIRKHGQKLSVDLLTGGFRSQVKVTTGWVEKFANALTSWFGTILFLALNVILFATWILWNTGLIGAATFDPFPFNLLTMVVSLEAIALSIIVLISQNRQSKIAELRQRMDFEIDIRAEEEITKILQILAELRGHHGLTMEDKELEEMIKKTDLRLMEEKVSKSSA